MYFDYGLSEDELNKVFLYETYEVRLCTLNQVDP